MNAKAATPATETTATKTPRPRGYRPCTCSEYFFADEVEIDGQPDFANVVRTGCSRQVAGRTNFAPGHDAKLKSLMIAAKRTGHAVHREHGGVLVTSTPEKMAAEYGFAHMVRDAATTKAPRKSAKAAKAEAPRTVAIKVGRWTYQATVDAETGRATYRNGKGVEVSTSSYKLA